ncbi:hypothetical protein ACHAWF_003982 [Thalassiosira exigua]
MVDQNPTQLARFPHDLLLQPPGANSSSSTPIQYTHIDTDCAIDMIGSWIYSISSQLPSGFPLKAVKEAMAMVMKKISLNLAINTSFKF